MKWPRAVDRVFTAHLVLMSIRSPHKVPSQAIRRMLRIRASGLAGRTDISGKAREIEVLVAGGVADCAPIAAPIRS